MIMQKNNGGAAFPGEHSIRFGQTNDCNEGMTLRDYFAAKAMQGLISEPLQDGGTWLVTHIVGRENLSRGVTRNLAIAAYQIADAMLAAREA